MSQTTTSSDFHDVFHTSDSFDVETLNFSENSHSNFKLERLQEQQPQTVVHTETRDEESNLDDGNRYQFFRTENDRESVNIDNGKGQLNTPVIDIDDFINSKGAYRTPTVINAKTQNSSPINFKKLAIDVAKEVYKKAGYNLTKEQADYIANSKDEFKSLVDIIDLLKPSFYSKEVEELNEFLENGGSYHDWFTHNNNIVDDFTYVPYDGPYGEEIAIIELYYRVAKDLGQEEITRIINSISEKDIANYASKALVELERLKKEREQYLLERQSNIRKEYLQRVAEYKDNVRQYVKSSNFDISLNIPLNEKEKNEFIKFVSEFDAEGKSRFMTSLDDFENMIKLALLAYKKKHLEKTSNKVEESKTGLERYVN